MERDEQSALAEIRAAPRQPVAAREGPCAAGAGAAGAGAEGAGAAGAGAAARQRGGRLGRPHKKGRQRDEAPGAEGGYQGPRLWLAPDHRARLRNSTDVPPTSNLAAQEFKVHGAPVGHGRALTSPQTAGTAG